MADRQKGVTKLKVKVPKCQSCKRSREQSVYVRELQRTLKYFLKVKSVLANAFEHIKRVVIT